MTPQQSTDAIFIKLGFLEMSAYGHVAIAVQRWLCWLCSCFFRAAAWVGVRRKVRAMPDVETWRAFADGLRPEGLHILATSDVREIGDEKTRIRILGLMLLSRTLSNLKSSLMLLDAGQTVEARILARCCYENTLWIQGLMHGGKKFMDEVIGDHMKHRRISMRALLKGEEFDEAREQKVRQWLRDTKNWETSDTLTPGAIAKKVGDEAYIFYRQFSLDAHPSIETLNRYFVPSKADGDRGTIDVEPEFGSDEVVETLNLLCLPVVRVFLGVSHLLGHAETPPRLQDVAEEYKRLTIATKL